MPWRISGVTARRAPSVPLPPVMRAGGGVRGVDAAVGVPAGPAGPGAATLPAPIAAPNAGGGNPPGPGPGRRAPAGPEARAPPRGRGGGGGVRGGEAAVGVPAGGWAWV